jgi:hypothetical protein
VCASCFTRIDAVALNSAGLLAMAVVGRRRVLDAWHGRSRTTRRQASYDETAGFLREMGHDPDLVLGPPPAAAPPVDRSLARG